MLRMNKDTHGMGSSGWPLTDIDAALLCDWPLPALTDHSDKEDRGRALVIGGSEEMPGAAMLAVTGALRAGAGKVTIATHRAATPMIAVAIPEARVIGLSGRSGHGFGHSAARELGSLVENFDAVLVGPGMQDEAATAALTTRLLTAPGKAQWVLDAYAMTACASGGRSTNPRVLVTPHAGEMAHLMRVDKNDVLADPLAHACNAAVAWNAVVVMKGAITYIASPERRAWRHRGGNVGLGISGSGDTLAGIIAGVLSRGASLEQAAVWGVALHARAGERLARRVGTVGYLAREIADEIPALLDELGGNRGTSDSNA
jgi:ADP-dependent NAD(P)H-hydrate dehydratase